MTQIELKQQMVQAMKNHEDVRLSVLRGLISSCTNELVAKGRKPDEALSEDEILALVRRAAKQRKDSMEQFQKGGRADLVAKENEELHILESLLPPELSREEILKLAKEKATALAIAEKSKANQLMGALMKDLKGRADGTLVKEIVDNLFA